MAELEKLMARYTGPNCDTVTPPTLHPGQREHVLVVHDESVFYTNDDENVAWVEDGRGHSLKRKNVGGGCNTSAFLSEEIGVLRMTDEQYAAYNAANPDSDLPQDSTVTMKIGTKYATAKTGETLLGLSHNGWWTNDLVIAQLNNAIKIFEQTHPGKVAVFQFDNSTGHNAFADDALIAHKMSATPGGKQPLMRSGHFNGQDHHMVFAEGDFLLFPFERKMNGTKHSFRRGERIDVESPMCGWAKGTRQVCLERCVPITNGKTAAGKTKYITHCCKCAKKTPNELVDDELLRAAGMSHLIQEKVKHKGRNPVTGKPCCCVWALQQHEDFMAQKNAVEETILAAGHKVIFLPKFHPELNFIERFWAHCKRWLRKHCMYTMSGLWENLPRVFSTDITPVTLIRKFARTSWRWMDVYRRGLPPDISAFCAKQYHGHRGVPEHVDDLINQLKEQRRVTAAVQLERLVSEFESTCSSIPNPGDMSVVDPSTVDKDRFIGLWIVKEFEGQGDFQGQVISHDMDILNRPIFHIRYLDGDEEDLFLDELVLYVKPHELFLLCRIS